jgi:adenylate cyclase
LKRQGPLAGFGCGIGIAAGGVIAGMLGTIDQRKIGVFGPAVNLAARLESMTKMLGVSILLDRTVADLLKTTASELSDRVREIAKIRPAGMGLATRVYELMHPANSPLALTQKQLKLFQVAREDFQAGNWDACRRSLHQLAADNDGPSKFLLHYIDQTGSPPPGWSGEITLSSE